jgi:hypothetical protein
MWAPLFLPKPARSMDLTPQCHKMIDMQRIQYPLPCIDPLPPSPNPNLIFLLIFTGFWSSFDTEPLTPWLSFYGPFYKNLARSSGWFMSKSR